MNKVLAFVQDERGGVSILVFSLLALSFMILVVITSIDFAVFNVQVEKVKHHLSLALHAASLEIDKNELSNGNLRLDLVKAREAFDRVLYMNMGLKRENPGSDLYLANPNATGNKPYLSQLRVRDFFYMDEATLSTFPRYSGTYTFTLSDGRKITKTFSDVLTGPSILAIIEIPHDGIGSLSDLPYFIEGSQEVRFIY